MVDTAFVYGLAGGLVGLLGAGAGLAAMVWGMGYTEYLGGKKRNPALAPVEKEEIRSRLLALNSSGLPYEIKPGTSSDLLLEWRITDAKWLGIFSQESQRQTYRAYLALDDQRKAVRYYEETGEVDWSAGTDGVSLPRVHFQARFFKGRILFRKSWGVGYGLKDGMKPRKLYEYSVDIGHVRDPIRQCVESSGWEFVPVVRKGHATRRVVSEPR